MTHIRIDARTRFEADTEQMFWIALCFAERPESSVSEAHMREVFAGSMRPFCDSVRICPGCARILVQKINS